MNKKEKKEYILKNVNYFKYQIKYNQIEVIDLINKLRTKNNLQVLLFNTKIPLFDFLIKENMEIMLFPYKKIYKFSIRKYLFKYQYNEFEKMY